MHHGEAHMPQHSARALPLQLAAGGVGSPASGAVSSSRPTPPPREEPQQQQQPDHASASWKTVQLDDMLITIAVFSSSDMRWSVPPFHEKVRTTTLSRWLLKKHGQVVVQRTHQTVCPLLPCRWFPSGKMLQRKRKLDDSGGGCRFIVANCTWILMYLLAANHFKTQGQGSSDCVWQVVPVAAEIGPPRRQALPRDFAGIPHTLRPSKVGTSWQHHVRR